MDDLTELPVLSASTIIQTLQERFAQDKIYVGCQPDAWLLLHAPRTRPSISTQARPSPFTNSCSLVICRVCDSKLVADMHRRHPDCREPVQAPAHLRQ